MKTQKRLDPKLIYLSKQNKKLWGCNKIEGLGLGAVNGDTVTRKYMGKWKTRVILVG